jgi:hypothetical protein
LNAKVLKGKALKGKALKGRGFGHADAAIKAVGFSPSGKCRDPREKL